ncbi:MAG: hypothetical protein ACTHJX_04970, partial [Terriglobales bacterium]
MSAAHVPATPFHPTPPQRRLLDFVDAHPCLKTIGELCDGAGISRATYYRWTQDPGFRIWFAAVWSSRLIMDGVVLINQARLLASRHFPYWKALFNLTFDPKGCAVMQQWQQACFAAPSDAFTQVSEADPCVSSESESNQQLTSPNETNFNPTPLQVARLLKKATSFPHP